jgi:hypothetical protein
MPDHTSGDRPVGSVHTSPFRQNRNDMIRKLFSVRAARPIAAGTEAIVWAYRLFLNREPESEATVEKLSRELPTWDAVNGGEPPMQTEEVDDPAEIEDPWTGMRPGEVSNTFLFRKRAGA